MYKIRGILESLPKTCKRVSFEIPKRTKKAKKLEVPCGDPRPCDEMPHRPKTGILFLHPGEATTIEEIHPYLSRVSKDKTFKLAAPSIRTTCGLRSIQEVSEQYKLIGGHSPLLSMATKLGHAVEYRLQKNLRLFAPYKSLVSFRYASPLLPKAMEEFNIHNIKHLVVVSLEPHYYCQKTGPCYDGIYKYYKKHDLPKWSWTIVDRWPMPTILAGAFAQNIESQLNALPPKKRHEALILFVANGLTNEDVTKGEMYMYEVGVTVHSTMQIMKYSNDFCLTWLQTPFSTTHIGPSLEEALCRAYKDGRRYFVVVPISYICECLDTLYEIDISILHKLRDMWGCDVIILRTPAPHDSHLVIETLSSTIEKSLQNEHRGTEHFLTQCHGCRMVTCSNNKMFLRKLLSH